MSYTAKDIVNRSDSPKPYQRIGSAEKKFDAVIKNIPQALKRPNETQPSTGTVKYLRGGYKRGTPQLSRMSYGSNPTEIHDNLYKNCRTRNQPCSVIEIKEDDDDSLDSATYRYLNLLKVRLGI